jgi:ferric-dicitrate binding protein FerR (iron transport regulator)
VYHEKNLGMALDREDYNRIAAYCTGQMTEEERRSFAEWRSALADDTVIRELETIWENSGVRATDPSADTDIEWTRLQKNLQQLDEKDTVSNFGSSFWLRMAATLIIVSIAGVWLIRSNKDVPTTHDIGGTSIIAEASVKTAFLPDSSRIWLNSGSSLEYDDDFGKSDRRVRLRGEGFFKVSSDQSKPFIIQTENALVRVVGTSFNIREENGSVALQVEEGLVRFGPRDSVNNSSMLVAAGESAVIEMNTPVAKAAASDEFRSRWRLKNNPLYETEKKRPARFLDPQFAWRKNVINQSVIRGNLTSNAELATYRNIVLMIQYTNARGRSMESEVHIGGPIYPGETIHFEKRLFDVFRDTRSMKLSVKSADILEE